MNSGPNTTNLKELVENNGDTTLSVIDYQGDKNALERANKYFSSTVTTARLHASTWYN